MTRRSRRDLLELVGSGTAAVLAGCQASPPREGSTSTATSTETPSASTPETEPDTATESPTRTPIVADCDAVSRPKAAWPVPRRSPARDGYVVSPDGIEEAPASAWAVEPTAPEDSFASPRYGQPMVAQDTVFVTNFLDRGPQRPMDGYVHALDAGTGDRRWASVELRSPSHPVIWGELVVVVVAQEESFDAKAIAFDRTDGTRRWTRAFEARARGFVTAGDHLYLALGAATARGTVLALAQDGSVVWRRDGAFADHVNEGPTVGTDTVYVSTREGRLHGLDRDDGTTIWTHRYEHLTEQRPYVTDIVATDCTTLSVVERTLNALDDDGTLVWEAGDGYGSLATDGETLYATTDIDDGSKLQALDVATGDVHWTVGGPVQTFAPAVVGGDTVYLQSAEHILALDQGDGTERWRTDGSLGDLVLANGTLYGTAGGTLKALR